ncbi:sce7726 family protein [Staphylococcus aureus]
MDNRNMINRVFSQKILHQIAIKNKSDVVDEAYDFYIQGPKNINVIQKMKSLYNYLKKSYRNEYFYKTQYLINLSSRTTYLIQLLHFLEMPIGKSIADFILLNGKGVVYEIKTELDKLDRLDNQINDYYEVFNYVVVITNDKHLNKVMAKLKITVEIASRWN